MQTGEHEDLSVIFGNYVLITCYNCRRSAFVWDEVREDSLALPKFGRERMKERLFGKPLNSIQL